MIRPSLLLFALAAALPAAAAPAPVPAPAIDLPALLECRQRVADFAALGPLLADPLKATIRFEIEETGIDWFDLRLVFDIEGVTLKPAEIRRLIAARGGFVRLADGTWRSVVLELNEEQRQAIEGLGLDLQDLSDEAHPLHLRQLRTQRAQLLILAAQRLLQLIDIVTGGDHAMTCSSSAEFRNCT